MADFIVMPKLGFDMREGVLVSWLKQIGDMIEKGEVVAEIESDKATLELESQVSGTLLDTLEDEGAIVPIGANLAIVGAEGEDISGLVSADSGLAEPAPSAKAETSPEPVESKPDTGAAAQASEAYPGGVKATPVARRVAREHDVDLTQVLASGSNGRIRKADVEAFIERREVAPVPTPAAAPAVSMTPVEVAVGPDDVEVETPRLRQIIARRMLESKLSVPHFYVTTEVDMAPALALRKEINALLDEDQKISVNDMIVKAAGLALRAFPNVNASFAGQKLVRHTRINVGSAVAVEGGLTTVVQKDTDISTLSKIAADNKVMIGRAREGKIHPDDVQGGTFTVSNLGPWDVENFIAIINPPEAAILAVSTARQVPVVVDGEISVGVRMKATISADHRVTDGAEAAQFLQHFKQLLESPMRLLI